MQKRIYSCFFHPHWCFSLHTGVFFNPYWCFSHPYWCFFPPNWCFPSSFQNSIHPHICTSLPVNVWIMSVHTSTHAAVLQRTALSNGSASAVDVAFVQSILFDQGKYLNRTPTLTLTPNIVCAKKHKRPKLRCPPENRHARSLYV